MSADIFVETAVGVLWCLLIRYLKSTKPRLYSIETVSGCSLVFLAKVADAKRPTSAETETFHCRYPANLRFMRIAKPLCD